MTITLDRRLALAAAVALPCAAGALLLDRATPAAFAQDAQPPQRQAAAAGSGIGVIDVPRVLQDSALGKQLQARGQGRQAELQATLEQLQRQIQEEQSALAQLREGTEPYEAKADDIRELLATARVRQELSQEEIARLTRDSIIEVYEQMEQAVAEVARERGLDVVIRTAGGDRPEDLRSVNPQQLGPLLNAQNVIYHSAGVDVTGEVVAKMDQLGDAGGEAAPADAGAQE